MIFLVCWIKIGIKNTASLLLHLPTVLLIVTPFTIEPSLPGTKLNPTFVKVVLAPAGKIVKFLLITKHLSDTLSIFKTSPLLKGAVSNISPVSLSK